MAVCCQGGEGGSVGIANLTLPLIMSSIFWMRHCYGFNGTSILCPYNGIVALQVQIYVISTALIHLGYAILDSGIFFCFVLHLCPKSNP